MQVSKGIVEIRHFRKCVGHRRNTGIASAVGEREVFRKCLGLDFYNSLRHVSQGLAESLTLSSLFHSFLQVSFNVVMFCFTGFLSAVVLTVAAASRNPSLAVHLWAQSLTPHPAEKSENADSVQRYVKMRQIWSNFFFSIFNTSSQTFLCF